MDLIPMMVSKASLRNHYKHLGVFFWGGVRQGSDPYLPLSPGEFQTQRNLSQAFPGTRLAGLLLAICVI
jgi:hypothetical protein